MNLKYIQTLSIFQSDCECNIDLKHMLKYILLLLSSIIRIIENDWKEIS